MLREAVIAGAVGALVAVPASVRAQPATAVEEASRHFQNGVSDYERGDYLAAYAEFESAYTLTSRWEVLYNLGVTAQKLARYRDALHRLDRYMREGGAAIPPDRRAAVEAAVTDIKRTVAIVDVTIDGGPAQLEVDGHVEEPPAPDDPVLVAAGKHTLVATRGDQTARQDIQVESGARVDVHLVPRAPITTARLTVRSKPPGAALSLDEQPLGAAPWSGDVKRGGHTLAAALEGYGRVRQEIGVEAGQDREYTLELSRERRWYQRWYVIAGLGAVAIAAGGTAFYFATRNDDEVIHFPAP